MEKKSKPMSKKATLAAAILWSIATAIGLIRFILDLNWSKGTTLSFQRPFLDVIVAILFLINAVLYWRRFANCKETND